MYDLLIFDLDGTLVDSAADIARALNATLAAEGLPTHTEEAVMRMVGDGAAQLVGRAVGPAEQGRVGELTLKFRQRYGVEPVVDTRPFPGVAETLAVLGKFTKAVVTNKPGRLSRTVLAELGLAQYFFAVLGEDDVSRRKPDPEGVNRLIKMAGARPERALLIGDSPVDAAGIDVCLASYGYGRADVLSRLPARFRIDGFSQLLDFLT